MELTTKIFSLQAKASEARDCVLQYMTEAELKTYEQRLNTALPQIRAACDAKQTQRAMSLARELDALPKARTIERACGHYRMELAGEMAGIMGYLPENMTPQVRQMMQDLQRTAQRPCV